MSLWLWTGSQREREGLAPWMKKKLTTSLLVQLCGNNSSGSLTSSGVKLLNLPPDSLPHADVKRQTIARTRFPISNDLTTVAAQSQLLRSLSVIDRGRRGVTDPGKSRPGSIHLDQINAHLETSLLALALPFMSILFRLNTYSENLNCINFNFCNLRFL